MGIKIDTVKEYIRKLKSKKLLKRIGTTSKGYWEVIKNGEFGINHSGNGRKGNNGNDAR